MALAVSSLSPVTITVRMPIARSSANRSFIPGLTTSDSRITPTTRVIPPLRAATTSGVPPCEAMLSVAASTSDEMPPAQAHTALVAPLRISRPSMLMPLIRVWAVKATSSVSGSEPCGRAGSPNRSAQYATMLVPSGVWSARLDSRATSASSPSVAPPTGISSVHRRLPKVIVPVLSSSSVSTSPAASTARPDLASTLRCTSRSMPAMPIAESSAPIVVGIRHTRSAVSMITDSSEPE